MDNTQTINELQKLKNELIAKVQQIDQTISTLKAFSGISLNGLSTNGKADAKYLEFDKDSSIKSKLAYVLKKENRFLHMRQIAQVLHRLEPDFSEKEWITKLYPAIAELKKAGSIVKYSVGESNVNSFWGSKNWIDGNEEPKKDHKYDADQVRKFGAEEINI